MSNSKSDQNKDEILERLKRIEGQIKAIRKMYEKKEGCFDITQQIAAVRSALNNVAVMLLEEESSRCIKENDNERLSKVIKNLFKLS